MDRHMMHNQTRLPVCWDKPQEIDPAAEIMTATNIDLVTCVDCLRRLVKDAVQYSNGRKASRSW